MLVNKPSGCTSFRVVSKIKRHFNLKKVGHAGTLDPFATGLLVILINKATKLSGLFLEADKSYTGTMVLGKETDTYDVEGKVIKEKPVTGIKQKQAEEAFKAFSGHIKQKPPLFSAVKLGGKKAYQVARKGGYMDLPEREVTVYELKLLDYVSGDNPRVHFSTRVSKGTYIRSLAYDIGRKLRTGAYLEELERQTVGKFSLNNASTLADILKWDKHELAKHLVAT